MNMTQQARDRDASNSDFRKSAGTIVSVFFGVQLAIGLVASAVASPESTAQLIARQALVAKNLERIGAAMKSFSKANNGRLPPANANGLSWRVMLLPYLGAEKLYKQFNLNEPWDSPHNMKLLDSMPDVYHNLPDSRHKTSLLVFAGEPKGNRRENCLYASTPLGRTEGPALFEITDESDKTLAVVETTSEKAVPWTKPEDIPFDHQDPASALRNMQNERVLALFCDGTVYRLAKEISPQLLRQLVFPNDSQPEKLPKWPEHTPASATILCESIDDAVHAMLRKTGSYDCDLFSIVVRRVDEPADRGGRPKLIKPTIILKPQPGQSQITLTATEAKIYADRKARLLWFTVRDGQLNTGATNVSLPGEQKWSFPIFEPPLP